MAKKKRGAGEGTIVKRKDGLWMAAATVGFDVEKSKPKRKYFYGKSRGEVAEKLEAALPKVRNGTYKEPAKALLADWLDTWLNDYMKPSLRPTTWASYEVQVRKHIKPALGHIRLNQLQTSHLQKLYNDKLAGDRADGKEGGLSPRSVRYIHVVIHGALEQAKKEGAIIVNPADAVKLPKKEKKEIGFLDSEAVSRFLGAAKGTRYFTAYLLELATGLRRGELLALRWKDVDLKARTVTVNQSLVRLSGRGLVFQAPKTKLGNRTISIPVEVVGVLKFHEKRQDAERDEAGDTWQKELTFLGPKPEKNDLVFTNEIGNPTCPRALTRHFERLFDRYNREAESVGKEKKMKQEDIEAMKLQKITFHGLRHSYATLCLQQGVDYKTIQENLGHFDPAFTLSVYSGVTDKMKKTATEKIGSVLSSSLQNE